MKTFIDDDSKYIIETQSNMVCRSHSNDYCTAGFTSKHKAKTVTIPATHVLNPDLAVA